MKRKPFHIQQQDDNRHGAAVVEFALVLPLFLILVLGTAELGRATDISTSLSAAVREGGRLGSMDFGPLIPANTTANQKVIADVKAMMAASGIPGNLVTVTITHAGGAADGTPFNLEDKTNYLKHFRVRATVPFDAVSVFPVQFVAGSTLRSEIVFRLGRSEISS